MLEEWLEVSMEHEKKAQAGARLTTAMEALPTDVLHSIVKGEEKLAYVEGERDGEWLDRFKGTPLFNQALEICKAELQCTMERNQQRAEERATMDARRDTMDARRDENDAKRDELNVRKQMLNLELASLEQGGEQAGDIAEDIVEDAGGTPEEADEAEDEAEDAVTESPEAAEAAAAAAEPEPNPPKPTSTQVSVKQAASTMRAVRRAGELLSGSKARALNRTAGKYVSSAEGHAAKAFNPKTVGAEPMKHFRLAEGRARKGKQLTGKAIMEGSKSLGTQAAAAGAIGTGAALATKNKQASVGKALLREGKEALGPKNLLPVGVGLLGASLLASKKEKKAQVDQVQLVKNALAAAALRGLASAAGKGLMSAGKTLRAGAPKVQKAFQHGGLQGAAKSVGRQGLQFAQKHPGAAAGAAGLGAGYLLGS